MTLSHSTRVTNIVKRGSFQVVIYPGILKFPELCEEWALAECEGEGWWREARESNDHGRMDVRYAGVAPVERAASAPATALAVRIALQAAKCKF